MKLTLELTVECVTEDEARSLAQVLSPDNKSVPKDQSLSSRLDGASIVFAISSQRSSSCISSALGILSDVRLFHDVRSLTS